MVAPFNKKVPVYWKKRADNPKEESVTEETFEEPITEDSRRTLSLKTIKRNLSLRNLRETQSLRNLKRAPSLGTLKSFRASMAFAPQNTFFWLFCYSIS